MERRVCVWPGSNVSICTECLPNEFRIMSFTAKLQKVRFVTREREQDTVGVLFSSSLPLFSKASLSGCRLGWDACASGPNFFFLLPNLPRVRGDVSDIHRCRSTLQGTQRPSPGYINISSAIRKDPQTVAKKVPQVYTWLPTPPGDHNPFPPK